jgi:uncharacterized protein YjbI with pentapeptide repeats
MANHKHVEIITRGVVAWNQWREQDPDIKPNLGGINLFQAKLVNANLHQTDLKKTDLREADLTGANLAKADLRNANLRAAKIICADLKGANMSGAHLIAADLSKSDLRGADLRGIRLDGADLFEARLQATNLSNANLPQANLLGANLVRANLRGSNLTGAVLIIAKMAEADLSLANLTGAKLYGSDRDHWRIDGIKCEFAFWDGSGHRRTPAARDFQPGEFELLYRQAPTIEYPFEDGFTPIKAVMMDRVVKVIKAKMPEFELNLDSLIFRGVPRAVFSVLHREDCPRALELITRHYNDELAQPGIQEMQTCMDNFAERAGGGK